MLRLLLGHLHPKAQVSYQRPSETACRRCGFVANRPGACPGPKRDVYGICSRAVPLTDGARAPHECTLRCARSAGPHVSGDWCCKKRYRAPPPKPHNASPEGQAGPKKRNCRRPRKPEKPGSRASPQGAQPSTTNPFLSQHQDAAALGPSRPDPTPDGSQPKGPTAGQGSPDLHKPTPPSRGHKSAGQGASTWATHVPQGAQVSGSGGAASPSPFSMIPRPEVRIPSAPTGERIEFRELQAQVALFTQTVEALVKRSSLPTPTPTGHVLEAMDSAPSQHEDNAVLFTPMEARLSSSEAQMTSIETTNEDRLAATLQTVFDHIPGVIVAQLPQLALNTCWSKLKRVSNSQASWSLS
ncbi:hypothetical protein HPB51_000984 [Rhipicephalus microplus]|uniref:Uncharacterized protein n=1 Tax=Rhipicephalus microplus TaxID=6941 RepID=A0A9J6DE12_RHIMP|nr:hypothetical protein HPB51_000984 [Rhipicephalus microplus]